MAVAKKKPAAPAARTAVPDKAAAQPKVPEFSRDQDLQAYRDMLLIRRFEEKAGQMYGMGLIGGFCHLYIGQEAVVIGMQMTLKAGDKVITGYRDHGHMLACGMDPKGVMAELTGRRGGYSHGKGGSMHMFSIEKGFFGGHGIVAAQVPLGTGLAFANRYRGNDNVSLTYFGDGAANQGQVYESFNMAGAVEAPRDLHHREQSLCHGLDPGRKTVAWAVRRPRSSLAFRRAQGRDEAALGLVFDAESTMSFCSACARRLSKGGLCRTSLDMMSLVHEASRSRPPPTRPVRIGGPQHFLRYAGHAMRSVIVDYVRERMAERRGGDAPHVTLNSQIGDHPRR